MLGRDARTSGPLSFTLHLLTRQPACFLFLLRDRAARSDLPPANACHRHQGRVFHPAALTATMMAFFVSVDAAPRPDTAWCQRPPSPCANTLGERLQVGTCQPLLSSLGFLPQSRRDMPRVSSTCKTTRLECPTTLLSSLGFLPQSPSSEHETTKSIPLILGSGLSIPVILGSVFFRHAFFWHASVPRGVASTVPQRHVIPSTRWVGPVRL